MSTLHINRISLELFNTTLERYPETAPSTLAELDNLRYETIPAKLAKDKNDAHLVKADVEKLVEWKLKHGTFRPTLMNLVKSNSADLIKETTRLAFLNSDPMQSLKTLTSLRGIGPATASLLLSVHQPDIVPFFSDELFRWTHWDASGSKGGAKGWEKKIKYNVSEYREMINSVDQLRKRLGVEAVDAEKVAYVLGTERARMDDEDGRKGEANLVFEETMQEDRDEQEESRKRVQEALKDIRNETANDKESQMKHEHGAVDSKQQKEKTAKKQGTKRKAKNENVPTEGARRSTRRKA